MMKGATIGPFLLSILLLASSPRNSSAHSIGSHEGMIDEAPANSPSPTVPGTILEVLTRQPDPTDHVRSDMLNPEGHGITGDVRSDMLNPESHGITGEIHTNMSSPTVNCTAEGAHANTESPIVDNIIEAVNHLTKTFSWLQESMIGSYFDETVQDVENDLSNLPSTLAVNRRQILEGLYRSQDRVTIANAVLKQAANKIKSYSDNLKDVIDSHDASNRLLKYIAKKMAKYLNFSNGILKNALNKFIELKEEFSNTEAFVQDLNATLINSKDQVINKMKENKEAIQWIITRDLELKQKYISDKLNNLLVDDLDLKQQEIAEELKSRKEILEDQTLGICTGTLGVICPLTVTKVNHLNVPSGQVVMITECQNVPAQSNVTQNVEDVANGQKVLPEQATAVPNWQTILAEQAAAVAEWQNLPAEQAELVTNWQNMIADKNEITPDCQYLLAEQAVAFDKWQNLRNKFDIQNKLISYIERQNELLIKIDRAQESTSAYLSQVVEINNYIEIESDLMTKRQNNLETSVSDQQDISVDAVECALNVIKERIIVLRNTCTMFLNQDSP